MPTAATTYRQLFSVDAIAAALDGFSHAAGGEGSGTRIVERGREVWRLDDDAAFVAEYARGADWALIRTHSGDATLCLLVDGEAPATSLNLQLPHQSQIRRVLHVLDRLSEDQTLTASPPPVFIGHGQDQQWRELADHLRQLHDVRVLVYESAARAGLPNNDILASLAREAGFALLVHTADCTDEGGTAHSSDNVIHETGLFQGILGSARAIVLREEGCTSFANMAGINELRFERGNIASVYGDVLAVLRREFPATAGIPRHGA